MMDALVRRQARGQAAPKRASGAASGWLRRVRMHACMHACCVRGACVLSVPAGITVYQPAWGQLMSGPDTRAVAKGKGK